MEVADGRTRLDFACLPSLAPPPVACSFKVTNSLKNATAILRVVLPLHVRGRGEKGIRRDLSLDVELEKFP